MQCLSPTGHAPAHGAQTAQALRYSAGIRLRPALGCMHLPGLSCSGSCSGSPQRCRFSWDCVLCPSQVQVAQVFVECNLCDLLPFLSLLLFSGCTTGAPCEVDGDCPEPPEVLAKKPACSLVGKVSPGLKLSPSSPYGSGFLSLAGDSLQPAISVLSFVLCAVLAVSYV